MNEQPLDPHYQEECPLCSNMGTVVQEAALIGAPRREELGYIMRCSQCDHEWLDVAHRKHREQRPGALSARALSTPGTYYTVNISVNQHRSDGTVTGLTVRSGTISGCRAIRVYQSDVPAILRRRIASAMLPNEIESEIPVVNDRMVCDEEADSPSTGVRPSAEKG